MLFDLGTSYSFISKSKVKDLGQGNHEKMSYLVCIPSEIVPMWIMKMKFLSNLFVLEIEDLDVILGMDMLGWYKNMIDCEEQYIILKEPRGE